MRKLLAILALAGLAGGFATSALAEDVATPVGTLRVGESSIEADGDASNPDPTDGYIYADENGVCAADNGSRADHEEGSESCNEGLLPA